MGEMEYDIAIVGAGFGGSLLALILKRQGFKVILIDQSSHPRFSIGESSTPVADLLLKQLATDYDLPQFSPLTTYGSWCSTYPKLMCGLKRGFSYFFHTPQAVFSTDESHSRELMVAASSSDSLADTHWLRSDVDAFFAAQVQQEHIAYQDRTQVKVITHSPCWVLKLFNGERTDTCRAHFLLDASGGGRFLQKSLNLPESEYTFRTSSRSLFAHFQNVQQWSDVLQRLKIQQSDYPFPCDAAALHHFWSDGWMWQLRFRDGITSCGITSTVDSSVEDIIDPRIEWSRQLNRFPSIREQFSLAKIIRPAGGLQSTQRLQRLCSQVVGDHWAMLPYTAGFVDPLHSTGIAHTLSAISKLVHCFQSMQNKQEFCLQLATYEASLFREFEILDLLVAGCYQSETPRQTIAWMMLYFAATVRYESKLKQGESIGDFLDADDSAWRKTIVDVYDLLLSRVSSSNLEQVIRSRIAEENPANLCDPAACNLYHHTVVQKS